MVADERKLKRVIYNLISTALKFTPDGGRIAIDTRVTEAKGVGLYRVSPHLQISVSDSGIGLDKRDLDRVFNPFKQVDNTNCRKYQ